MDEDVKRPRGAFSAKRIQVLVQKCGYPFKRGAMTALQRRRQNSPANSKRPLIEAEAWPRLFSIRGRFELEGRTTADEHRAWPVSLCPRRLCVEKILSARQGTTRGYNCIQSLDVW